MLFNWLLASLRYSSIPQITIAPPLSALVITKSSLVVSFLRASRCFFVKLSNGKRRFSWFLISSLTAISKVWIVASMFFGVNELFFSLSDCKMVGS